MSSIRKPAAAATNTSNAYVEQLFLKKLHAHFRAAARGDEGYAKFLNAELKQVTELKQTDGEEKREPILTKTQIEKLKSKPGFAARTLQHIIDAKVPGFDLNDADPATGRIALHEAANNCQTAIGKMLATAHRRAGTIMNDMLRKDKSGAFFHELVINPFEFDPAKHDDSVNTTLYQVMRFTIERYNQLLAKKFPANAVPPKIVFVKNIFEMEAYLQNNKPTRLAFICKRPNVQKFYVEPDPEQKTIKPMTDNHVFVIYYEKIGNAENFVQFTSTANEFILLETNPNKMIQRNVYFSPFHTQVSELGCFEDCVIKAYKLLLANGLISFCQQNSIRHKTLCSMFTAEDKEEFTTLRSTSPQQLNLAKIKRRQHLHLKYNLQTQVDLFNQTSRNIIADVFELTRLPASLLIHIEHWETMRFFRTQHPEQFLKPAPSGNGTYLDMILAKGKKREAKTADDDIRKNLKNPDKKFDFSGPSFHERFVRFNQHYENYTNGIFWLFHAKVKSTGLATTKERMKITETLAAFYMHLPPKMNY